MTPATPVTTPLTMPVVWSDRHRLHAPGGGIWLGVAVAGDEEPARGDALRDALDAAGASRREPDDHGDGPLQRVHDPAFVEFLQRAHGDWVAAGHLDDPGQPMVVPYVFALPQATSGRPCPPAAAVRARVGQFCMDTMTLIGPGTYEAARVAVDGALTAADAVLAGAPAAYAAVRPPGHHVGAGFYGGSCYLNNAAVTAQYLRDRGVDRVGIVDIDAHHGNGTQEIFYPRADVSFGSVHVDPGAGWFPHFAGFAGERGVGPGEGANRNVALPPGAGDGDWLPAVESLVADALGAGAQVLVVSLGVDAAAGDPESPLQVTREGFRGAGRLLAAARLPTVFVQEGGYDLGSLGDLVLDLLGAFEGFEKGANGA